MSLFLTLACGGGGASDSDPGSDDGAGNVLATGECQMRCSARAVECGAPSDVAGRSCGELCSSSLTQEQAVCLEMTSCSQLQEIFFGTGEVCEIGAGGSGGSSGSSGSSSGGCQGYPRCDGNSVVTCSDASGTEVLETSACGANETCSNGSCSANACIEAKQTGCNAGNNPSNCCDDNMTCFGNGNQQGDTICCVPGNGPCSSHDDCCNSDNPDLPWRCIDLTCQLSP